MLMKVHDNLFISILQALSTAIRSHRESTDRRAPPRLEPSSAVSDVRSRWVATVAALSAEQAELDSLVAQNARSGGRNDAASAAIQKALNSAADARKLIKQARSHNSFLFGLCGVIVSFLFPFAVWRCVWRRRLVSRGC